MLDVPMLDVPMLDVPMLDVGRVVLTLNSFMLSTLMLDEA
jgi:hypothetical protein